MLVKGPEPPPPLPRVDGVEHRFVQANGIRIHVVELPIPLVHGMRDFAVGARIQ
jgi:hypothetical protein